MGWNIRNGDWEEAENILAQQIGDLYLFLNYILNKNYKSTLAMNIQRTGNIHPTTKSMLYSIKNECDEAVIIADSLSDIWPTGRNRSMYTIIPMRYFLAQYQFESKQYDQSIKSLLELQKVYTNLLGMRPLFYPKSFHLLGIIYEAMGDTTLAIKNYEKLLDLWKNADEDLVDLRDTKKRLARLKMN